MTRLITRRVLATCFSALLAAPVVAALKEGDTAPVFTAEASRAGQAITYSLKEALQKGPVIVYFYPAAFTGGCSLQAHTFAQNLEKFRAAGASVVGVSLDSLQRLQAFSADPNSCAGKFPVASDSDGRISRAFDLGLMPARPGRTDSRGQAITHDRVERSTFVVTPDGRIAAAIGGMGPEAQVQQALQAVQKLRQRANPEENR